MAFTSARARRPLKARVTAVASKPVVGQAVLVGLGGTALGAAQESGAGLHERGAAGQEVDHVRRPAHPSGGDERHEGAPPYRCQQRADGAVLVGEVVVGQAGPVSPGFAALQAEGIGPGPQRRRGLLGRGDRQHHQRPRCVQRPDDLGPGKAEGEADGGGRPGEHHLELVARSRRRPTWARPAPPRVRSPRRPAMPHRPPTRAGSAAGRPGTNTLTPKEETPAARTSAMSAASSSAVL